MRGLRLTVFILVFLSLTAELIRHSYVRWIEKHTSVLDKYDAIDKEIKEATSLDVLEKRLAQEFEKQKSAKDIEPSAQYNPDSTVFKLRQAITDWERRENEIRELRYFWVGGLVCLLLALGCHWRRLQWESAALQIAGFAEMTWWTSPSFAGPSLEFTRLLDNKIIFAAMTLALLLVFWFSGVLVADSKRHREVV